MDLMQQAVTAMKAGRKDQARELLLKVLEQDETNEQAWLWMAGAVADPTEQRICLENVLHLNPDNTRARQGLDWLRQKHPVVFDDHPLQPAMPVGSAQATEPPQAAAAAPLPAAVVGQTVVLDAPAAAVGQTVALEPSALPQQAPPAPVPIQDDLYVPHLAGDDAMRQPCPACGASTTMKDRRCPKCRVALVERVAPSQRSSAMARIAGIMAIIHAVLIYILVGGGGAILLLALWNSLKRSFEELGGSQAQLDMLYVQAVRPAIIFFSIFFLVGVFSIVIARGIMKGKAWAYWVGIIFYGLHLLIYGLSAVINNQAIVEASAELAPLMGNDPRVEGVLNTSRIILFILPIWFLIILVLLALAYQSFQGKLVRLIVDEDQISGDAETHFNRGIAYRKRKYWYMTMREWEKAVKMAPHDPTYHHALGIMYEHMKRPADALREFDTALNLNPNDPRIRQDRQRLAAQLGHGSAA